jgi:protein TonB
MAQPISTLGAAVQATLVPPPRAITDDADPSRGARAAPAVPRFRFESLVLTEPRSLVKGRSATLAVSLVVHSLLIAAIIILPILFDDFLPAPDEAVRAFFVTPAEAAPPPPPPPPPAPGVRAVARPPVAPHPEDPAKFVAPIETPSEVKPEEGISLGVEGGVPGGVEGGVPGGVIGGIVGGLPQEAPPPRVVRVGGNLKAPKLVRRVAPEYPELAKQARVGALIILEATVDTGGRVRDVTVLRGQPLFNDAAIAAVRQWVYKPLLLNGVPTEFMLTVTVSFHIQGAPSKVEGS